MLIIVNAVAVLRRFSVKTERFGRGGSINIDVFGWLFQDPQLVEMIEQEFWCYL